MLYLEELALQQCSPGLSTASSFRLAYIFIIHRQEECVYIPLAIQQRFFYTSQSIIFTSILPLITLANFFSVPSRLKSRVDFYLSPLSDIQLMLLLKLILFVGIFACTTACVAVRGQPERVCSLLPCRCHG